MTRAIKLMADYECFPLWEASPGKWGDIDPKDLPISNELRQRLLHWAATFDATLNRDDPAQSGFPNNESKLAFKNAGLALGEELKAELGADFSVIIKA